MMNLKDASSPSTLREPLRSIGAQDLLRLEHSYSGNLRKEGKLERHFLSLFRWRQFFVVLSQGCVYVYNDEFSITPKKSFSLWQFAKVERFEGGSKARNFCFKLVPKNHWDGSRDCNFACSTDEKRKIWMQHFLVEMMRANNLETPRATANEYTDIERHIFPEKGVPSQACGGEGISREENQYERVGQDLVDTSSHTAKQVNFSRIRGRGKTGGHFAAIFRKTCSAAELLRPERSYINEKPKLAPKPKLKASASEERFSSEQEDGYICMEFPKTNATLPFASGSFRKSMPALQACSVVPEPLVEEKQQILRVKATTNERVYEGGVEKAEKALGGKSEGTFAVAKETIDSYVLLVVTKFGIKKSKITKEASKWYLKKPAVFDSITSLIEFYKGNKVPAALTCLQHNLVT